MRLLAEARQNFTAIDGEAPPSEEWLKAYRHANLKQQKGLLEQIVACYDQ
jgi:hypothetical protein